MEIQNMTRTKQKVLDLGMIDVVTTDGKVLEDVPCKGVMVTGDPNEINDLPDYMPGTIGFIAGFSQMWQKAADGTWVEL